MAKIVGVICTSHVPAIGSAIARGAELEPHWKPFFDGYAPIRAWVDDVDPDLVVVLYNDHGLNFFLDKLPTFAVGAAPLYRNADEGWGLPTLGPYAGDPAISWHVIESLVADEFDVTTCQEMLVDHAFTVPVSLLWPDAAARRFRTLPIAINTIQHPLPTPRRCFKLGQALGRALESYPEDLRVLVLGTGGLSHQLDGRRAGFINREFDQQCLATIAGEPQTLALLSIRDLVAEAGTQGVELIMWLAARGTLRGAVTTVHQHYHVPVSNTAAGAVLLRHDA
jgi:protocatechuate 4,5-dioxygenase beta chain